MHCGPLRLFLLAAFAWISLNSVSLVPSAQALDIPRWWYYGQTAADLTQLFNQNNARATVIRVQDPKVPTFDVSMVQNTDNFASAWWWWWGVDANSIGPLLKNPNKRLISIDPYETPQGLRFVIVTVPNDGPQDRAWWWYVGVDEDTVRRHLATNNARLIDARPYVENGKKLYAVIMIANTGADHKNSEWWVGATPDFIATRFPAGLRVARFNPDPSGDWDAILVQPGSESWWWWYGFNGNQVLQHIVDDNSRLIDISPYLVNGAWEFASVEIGDNSPPQGGFEI
ncbi:hypothetical protein GP486_006746 [Trichoglossum hirsutum]|uniref:Uncharacterized protein n=1 Tax=Trichoglossum hirsutum TaxID=265104 RepID=A0A9P8IIW6_9PEZI|nr:hypothetical protein GP486_006746 [Trichoglossum hirsutum]